MVFAQPYWLLLLLLIPIAIWLERRFHRGRPPAVRYSSLHLVRPAEPTLRVHLRRLPDILRLVAVVLCIIALARPQQRNVVVERSTEGIDIMLVLDISTSMRARDFHPNRFEAARDVAAEFVQNRHSDRVGLIVFAGKAFTQVPLTIDYPFLLRMLMEVEMGVVEDGTAIGNALAIATNRLKKSDAEAKVVILLTDGQNNRGEVDPRTAAQVARTLGVRVYTVGVGTTEPVLEQPASPLRDRVSTATLEIDEESLRFIAETTGGQFFLASDKSGLRSVYREIDQLERTEIEEITYTSYGERFIFLLWPALGFMLLDVLLRSTIFRIWP